MRRKYGINVIAIRDGDKLQTNMDPFRTIAMDFWASVEHQLRYKKDNEFTSQMAEELLNCAQISADLDSRMGKLKKMIEK